MNSNAYRTAISVDILNETLQEFEDTLLGLDRTAGTFYFVDAKGYMQPKLQSATLFEKEPAWRSLEDLVSKVSGTYSLKKGFTSRDVAKTIKSYR